MILFSCTLQQTSTSSIVVPVASISIKEKQEYLVPVYATDKFGNDHKVLRRNSGNILSDD